MKRSCTLVVYLFFVILAANTADALTYQFDGTIGNSPFQAFMELNVGNKKLTVSLQNTTPDAIGFSIAGFGVSLLNYPAISSGKKWTLKAAGGKDITDRWYQDFVTNYHLSFFGSSAVLDGLYNPKYKGLGKDHYATESVFTADFTLGTPELNQDIAPFVYIGNAGIANNLYVKGTLVTSIVTPEPGTVILLGCGLIGLGIFLMLRKKGKK